MRCETCGAWPIQRVLRALAGIVLLAACGCGASVKEVPTGSVSGRVSMGGAALTEGTVTLIGNGNGVSASAPLQPDGTFSISAPIAAGTYKVAVDPPPPPAPDQLPPGTDPKPIESKIPTKYRSTGASTLSFEVKQGQSNEAVLTLD